MNKYTIKVSPTLTDGAHYKELVDIPADILTKTDVVVQVYPGIYTAPTDAVYNNIAFIGIGNRDEIVINGDMTIANTSTSDTVFQNILFTGSNPGAASDAACVTKLGAASAPIKFYECKFTNAEHAVRHNGELAFATTDKQVIMERSDATGTDQAIVANANAEVSWSALNTTANAYFQPGTGGGDANITVTVRASTSGGANAGLMTETVLGLIA